MAAAARTIRLTFQPAWDASARDRGAWGLFAHDPRVRTLLRVLGSYAEVRHVLPDRVSFEPQTTPPLLETVARFLGRQGWLVRTVTVG